MSDTITIPRATVQQVLEALENSSPDQYPEDAGVFYDAKNALRTALEQQAEPVARENFEKWAKSLPNYMDLSRFEDGYSDCNTDYAWAGWKAPQRQWVGLIDEDCKRMSAGDKLVAMWAEAKLKERNT